MIRKMNGVEIKKEELEMMGSYSGQKVRENTNMISFDIVFFLAMLKMTFEKAIIK